MSVNIVYLFKAYVYNFMKYYKLNHDDLFSDRRAYEH